MRCEVTYEELAEFSVGEATAERTREIEQHLAKCAACQERLERLQKADETLRSLPRDVPSAEAVLNARRVVAAATHQRPPEIMTPQEVAEFLRLSPDEFEWIAQDLPAFEIAGQIRVRRDRLVEWIAQRERSYTRAIAESEVARILAGAQ